MCWICWKKQNVQCSKCELRQPETDKNVAEGTTDIGLVTNSKPICKTDPGL